MFSTDSEKFSNQDFITAGIIILTGVGQTLALSLMRPTKPWMCIIWKVKVKRYVKDIGKVL